jgi:TPR repeat protein
VLAARALADAYSAGRGVPRDDALAAAWWDAAAEAGDPVSRARVRAAR